MINIISCAGFGNTGSSVVTDFFSEFSCIKVLQGSSFEFCLLHDADGIRDLENAVVEGNRLKTDLAIKRFIKLITVLNYSNNNGPNYNKFFNGHFLEYTFDYLKSLNLISWENGWWHRIYDATDELNFNNKIKQFVYEKKFNKLIKKLTYSLYEQDLWKPSYTGFTKQYYCHVSKEEFKKKTKVYLNRLFSEIAQDGEYLLVDQLFPSNVDSEYIEYFDNAKVIIVDRDPRDLYFMNKVYWGSGYIPSENVDIYIEWFKTTRNNVYDNKNILRIKFEDMIFNKDKTSKLLCDFVGIDMDKHDKPKTRFDESKSISNTQVYKRIRIASEDTSNIINEDIQKINTELKNYLYNFPEFTGEQKSQKEIIENLYKITKEKRFFDVFIFFMVIISKTMNKIIGKIKSIFIRK